MKKSQMEVSFSVDTQTEMALLLEIFGISQIFFFGFLQNLFWDDRAERMLPFKRILTKQSVWHIMERNGQAKGKEEITKYDEGEKMAQFYDDSIISPWDNIRWQQQQQNSTFLSSKIQ